MQLQSSITRAQFDILTGTFNRRERAVAEAQARVDEYNRLVAYVISGLGHEQGTLLSASEQDGKFVLTFDIPDPKSPEPSTNGQVELAGRA